MPLPPLRHSRHSVRSYHTTVDARLPPRPNSTLSLVAAHHPESTPLREEHDDMHDDERDDERDDKHDSNKGNYVRDDHSPRPEIALVKPYTACTTIQP